MSVAAAWDHSHKLCEGKDPILRVTCDLPQVMSDTKYFVCYMLHVVCYVLIIIYDVLDVFSYVL